MGVEETVHESVALLKRITEDPEAILTTLNLEERARVLSALEEIDRKAAGVRSEADLLYVANAVRRLVERTPPLANLLLSQDTHAIGSQDRRARTRRKVTWAQHQAAYRASPYAQERAVVIHNRVVECREKLELALREIDERSRDETQERSRDDDG